MFINVLAKFSPLTRLSNTSKLEATCFSHLYFLSSQNIKVDYASMVISTTGISRLENKQLIQ